jgi:hypothetical protein
VSDCQGGPIRSRKDARVAQLVEQRIENPRVGGSSPPPGTTFLVRSPRSQPVSVAVFSYHFMPFYRLLSLQK